MYLCLCFIDFLLKRTLPIKSVSGLGGLPCLDIKELQGELAPGEAKPNVAVVLRP